jgi:excisionase family DNA binding protein
VAAFLGVSTRNVRRLVASGRLPSYRVGRRVLVSYRDADQFIRQQHRRAPAMAIAPPSTETIDPATGKARPLSEEEQQARIAAVLQALEDIGQITDETDTDEVWSEVYRSIDETRPHRPLFEGRY